MAYEEEKQGAYDDIKEAGGKIWIIDPSVRPAPADPDKPWLGSDDPLDDGFEHVGLFVPLSENVSTVDTNPFAESILIPALNLPERIKQGTVIRKESGELLSVVNLITLDLTGSDPIMFTCEVNTWPGI